MISTWLHVVGVGEGGLGSLGAKPLALVHATRTVIGPPRMLAALRGSRQTLLEWQLPLETMIAQVLALRGSPAVILATGDPSWFGIGATLARHLEPAEFAIHPAPSAFSLAAARLRWPLQNVATVSLHGRPVAALGPRILPGNRVLALTGDRTTIDAAAALLVGRGYGRSLLTVLENLGGEDERVSRFVAEDWSPEGIGDFHVLAIDCVAEPNAPLLPTVPGLPDSAFASDGQLTKREVRAATLARLAPVPGQVLWDVGAGCGSIGIEWMRAARDARAIAFERDPARVAMIETNREALGVPGLAIVAGAAPGSLAGQAPPDAVFVGGGVAEAALFDACLDALQPGGRLVANAVTLDAEAALIARQSRHGGDLVRIAVAALDPIGGRQVLRPRLAVLQYALTKGHDG